MLFLRLSKLCWQDRSIRIQSWLQGSNLDHDLDNDDDGVDQSVAVSEGCGCVRNTACVKIQGPASLAKAVGLPSRMPHHQPPHQRNTQYLNSYGSEQKPLSHAPTSHLRRRLTYNRIGSHTEYTSHRDDTRADDERLRSVARKRSQLLTLVVSKLVQRHHFDPGQLLLRQPLAGCHHHVNRVIVCGAHLSLAEGREHLVVDGA